MAFIETIRTLKAGTDTWPAFTKGQSHKPIPTATIIQNYEKILSASASPREDKETAIVLKGLAVFTLLRDLVGQNACGNGAVLLAEHFRLDRKLREIWHESGIPHDKAQWLLDLCKALIRRIYIEKVKKSQRKHEESPGGETSTFYLLTPNYTSPSDLLVKNYAAADFRALLGVNVWDGIVWFNKERFEDLLEWVPPLIAPFADLKIANEWAKTIGKAGAKSGYQLDKLITEAGKVKKGEK